MPEVISGFPGVGKSTLHRLGFDCIDSDSSRFPKDDFPHNYVSHIKELLRDSKAAYVFVSSHEAIRKALHDEGISFTLVYPHIASKQEYMTKYILRGNSETFIDLMQAKWSEFIMSCARDPAKRIVLKPYQTLSDVLLKKP